MDDFLRFGRVGGSEMQENGSALGPLNPEAGLSFTVSYYGNCFMTYWFKWSKCGGEDFRDRRGVCHTAIIGQSDRKAIRGHLDTQYRWGFMVLESFIPKQSSADKLF